MPELPTKPMTIIGLEADRFRRLRAINLTPPETGIVELHGENEAGKSSILDLIELSLCGGKHPLRPIFSDEGKAEAKIDFGELTLWKRWTDPSDLTKCYLSIIDKSGNNLATSGAQGLIKPLRSQMVDLTGFMNSTNQDQVRQVLGLVELGIDLSASKLEKSAAEQDRLFSGRKEKELEGKVAELEDSQPDPDAPRFDMAAATQKLQDAIAANKVINDLIAERKERKDEYERAMHSLEKKRSEIESIKAQLLKAQEQEAAALQAVDLAVEAGREPLARWEALEQKEPIDLAPIQDEIKQAQEQEQSFGNADRLRERQAELEAEKQKGIEAQAKIDQIVWSQQQALDLVEWPATGLGYNLEGNYLTIDGIPFKEASQGRQLRASAELGMCCDVPIKVLVCREGSFLDRKNIGELSDIVAAKGWQVWMEFVADGPTGYGVHIEDGMASGSFANPAVMKPLPRPETQNQAN